jgi:predicted small lipoprotein YifL
MTPSRASLPTLLTAAAALLAACGGGGALDNPPDVANPPGAQGQKLSYVYFQRCVNPVLNAQLRVVINGVATVNTCASGGCHDNSTGTGGALRLFGTAPVVDPALGAAAVRASDMYKNYYSSLGETVVGSPDQSRIMNKPLVRGVLHGGGLIFENVDTPEAKVIRYWISRPMPLGQDEFSTAANSMFTPADPVTGVCNTD